MVAKNLSDKAAKRGRPKSGKAPDQIEREKAQKRRDKKSRLGLVALNTFIKPETREYINDIRTAQGLSDQGAALDHICSQLKSELK